MGDNVVTVVKVSPARLHKGNFVILEERYHLTQPITLRQEIGIKDSHKLARGRSKPGFQCASFVTAAVIAVQQFNVHPDTLIVTYSFSDDLFGGISRVIQDLYLQSIYRIIQAGNGLQQTIDHVTFIVGR
ncbi:hypothetical protein SDC9_184287 [bioreactor metagenome]|uniref:Uncharacterized protein n=1 Tax=bioreactor metagenome TaxID=1076179 RepID=A0A645HE20_9ZZZZ